MTRFNAKKPSAQTMNLAGGRAHRKSAKLELASILATTFLGDGFYRSGNETQERIRALISELPDKSFAAKAAVWARKEHGIRSATHLVAAEIGKTVKAEEWTKRFFCRVVNRPDDVTEILACYQTLYGKPIPNSMKKGLAKALSSFGEYQLAKYRGENHDVSLIDAVNLVHPVPTDALNALMKGTLKNTETWEAKLSAAGRDAENDEDLKTMKGEAWLEFLKGGKLGYFALLRNLRNMADQLPPEHFGLVASRLTDAEAIRKSLVLPFRFVTALKALSDITSPRNRVLDTALVDALELSLSNVPKFDGKTCVMLDMSGSMESAVTRDLPVYEVASLFAAILAKNNDADVIGFSGSASHVALNTRDSAMTIKTQLDRSFVGGGTCLSAAFQRMLESGVKYERIVILSDMQVWIDQMGHKPLFKRYMELTGATPKVFSFDLAGLGTVQFPEKDVFCLAGWSDKSLQTMQTFDKNPNAMVDEIEAVIL